jgi:cell division protein FtsQ
MKSTAGRTEHGGFWDRPQMMNLMAEWLMLAATAALLYAAVLVVVRLPMFALREVVLTTPIGHVSPSQLEDVARGTAGGTFFTVDLEQVRQRFQALPWVRQVQVRRQWPDRIELEIEEQEAAAVWRQGDGEARLVSTRGDVFPASADTPLPVLAGPPNSAPEVLQRYRDFVAALAAIGRKPEEVLLSPRLAWRVKLDDGMVLELGRDQEHSPVDERLKRFVEVYREAMGQLPGAAAILDLRYPNGFTVRPAAGRAPTKSKS